VGMRGPKKKPSKLEKLQGNPGKRKANDREPQPRTGQPRCPQWLDAAARAEWKRVAPELKTLGLLTVVDVAALAGYCQAFSRWKSAEKLIKREGLMVEGRFGQPVKNPAIDVADKALRQVRDFAREFGFTPSARTGIRLPEQPVAGDQVEDYLDRENG